MLHELDLCCVPHVDFCRHSCVICVIVYNSFEFVLLFCVFVRGSGNK